MAKKNPSENRLESYKTRKQTKKILKNTLKKISQKTKPLCTFLFIIFQKFN